MINFLDLGNKKAENATTFSASILNTGHIINARTTSTLCAKLNEFQSNTNGKLIQVNLSLTKYKISSIESKEKTNPLYFFVMLIIFYNYILYL